MKHLLIIAAIALSGCSANYHLRKAIAKDPTILTEGKVIEYVTDTIEVVVPELRVDTLHEWSVDTVTTYVDRVRIRTKVDTVQRTVYVDVTCPADTVYVEHTTPRTIFQPRVKPKGIGFDWRILLLIVGIGVFAFVIRDK
jgi:hypothetical protein